ncbi:hypothetical protein [Pseudoalteromonas shioyasakiensis]|uniref:hypothetical protein n=1 Tax=Pseudoalteromonas shioyasakiensis TaxID=1190813 RepID=UPI002551E87F|nr:hypothetical protein [Pseudoalteromonas shioyasakiensis]MDK9682250.1 hypothetical protein [Pseudoalteromonas shioyasakiensis]
MPHTIKSLWKDDKAYLPLLLSEQYKNKLIEIGMLEYAAEHVRKEDKEGPVGGASIEETHRHFAERFSNSCIRLQYVLIDPKEKFGHIPEYFYSTFFSGDVALLDAPCGTGAGALSLLYTLRELRLENKLPALPLKVSILAGDFSTEALKIYENMLEIAKPKFEEVNMFIEFKLKQWDAFEASSTQFLLDEFRSFSADEYFVIVSAFSGIDKKFFDKLCNSITHMQLCLSTVPNTMVHIEPETKKGKNFFRKIKEILNLILGDNGDISEFKPNERFFWKDPINLRDVQSSVMVSLNCRDKKE